MSNLVVIANHQHFKIGQFRQILRKKIMFFQSCHGCTCWIFLKPSAASTFSPNQITLVFLVLLGIFYISIICSRFIWTAQTLVFPFHSIILVWPPSWAGSIIVTETNLATTAVTMATQQTALRGFERR